MYERVLVRGSDRRLPMHRGGGGEAPPLRTCTHPPMRRGGQAQAGPNQTKHFIKTQIAVFCALFLYFSGDILDDFSGENCPSQ